MHTTNFENFINIFKSGQLKSRNQLYFENVPFVDNAEQSVLEITSEVIKSKTRFYYRFMTPTNYSAFKYHNQKNPVILLFDKNLIYNRNILFCDGCACSSLTTKTNDVQKALNFQWDEIFSKGPFNSEDKELKNHRNAEFLTSSPVTIDKVTKIYFKNNEDYNRARLLFGEDNRFELKPSVFD